MVFAKRHHMEARRTPSVPRHNSYSVIAGSIIIISFLSPLNRWFSTHVSLCGALLQHNGCLPKAPAPAAFSTCILVFSRRHHDEVGLRALRVLPADAGAVCSMPLYVLCCSSLRRPLRRAPHREACRMPLPARKGDCCFSYSHHFHLKCVRRGGRRDKKRREAMGVAGLLCVTLQWYIAN